MRQMFSKKQIEELSKESVSEGIESGEIQVGTKLYRHELTFTSGDTLIYISNYNESYDSLSELIDEWLQGYIINGFIATNDYGNGVVLYIADASTNLAITYYEHEDGAVIQTINVPKADYEEVIIPL